MDAQKFEEHLKEWARWQIVHHVDGGDVLFSTVNMMNDVLIEAVLDDVLNVTMLEEENSGFTANFRFQELVRLIDDKTERMRVNLALHDPSVQAFLEKRSDTQLRIDKTKLQACMDYIGVWYDGYTINTNETVFMTNKGAIEEAAEKSGGIEQLVQSISMDARATHQTTNLQ